MNFGGKTPTPEIQRKDSGDAFQKARDSDSDFEFDDDFIDEDEEWAGASGSIKLSIRALNFNRMIADK